MHNISSKTIQQALEQHFQQQCSRPGPLPLERLYHAMAYATLNGGKRLRALLHGEMAHALGVSQPVALSTACAIELLHAQSLVHDDLPCMDDDDLRRGQPTVHKAYDEATAVLVGDALIAMAFGCIAQTPHVEPAQIVAVIAEFATVASVGGLVNGQYMDMVTEGHPFNADTLRYIHENKTGALFGFACVSAGLWAKVSATTLAQLQQTGMALGLAFQMMDDVLDCQTSASVLGKTPGKDAVAAKATYPALLGLESAQQAAQAQLELALTLLAQLPISAAALPRLQQLATTLVQRQA